MRMSFQSKSAVNHFFALTFAALFVLLAPGAMAQDLKLALSSPPTSMDPHFYNLFPNLNVSDHIFETMVTMDADSRIIPGLAESWTMINNLTWEFKLRKGVKFHDGSDLTTEDVAWSIDRPATIIGSPGKFDVYTKAIINKKIVDANTIRFTTKEPYPLLLADLTSIYIVSKKATTGLSSDDFASGKGMVGTGPYKFVKFLRDDRLELDRNDGYWGKKPVWPKVTLRFIPNGATRLAALLADDVQAIENVPTPDLAQVRANQALALFSKVSHRVIYLYPDTRREKSPFITDRDGKPLDKNPLQDARVRIALSMAINREAIKERVMEGLSEPTSNLVPGTLFGHNPALKVLKYDPEGAKKLLAEAGYPNGFGLTLHTPNNRYVNDEKIAQTIAQMWSRVGVATKIEGLPMGVYSARGAKQEYSMGLLGWGAQTGEVSSPLRALVACENPAKGLGGFNWLKYCNPKMDEPLLKALNTVDDRERLKLLQDATAILIHDGGVIPLHHQVTTWATKKGIVYLPRTDERTHAYQFSQ
ncbi:peptide/nickel transport system substrate-binding protein [Actimicrobium sp. GrIS 1.19]|uniref:ABC transporter substrate-binding protein n=1 Tax=Actimicrobium sp. GrIS 1.19 TaxID=3071708 RepID=UPI002E062295|nr:peptide/nickel transport system substrate-binding protein [Actimicrobium sp. GrIS 1.19]